MKKFKVKNQPKRKYVRKNSANVNFSASRAALFGMVPFFLSAIAFFILVLISNQALIQLSKLDLALTFPTIPYTQITEPLVSLYEKTLQSISSITLPSIPKITIALPTIDFQKPLTEIATLTTTVIQTLQIALTNLAIFCYNTIVAFLSLLDPRPLIPLASHSITAIFSATIQMYIMQLAITDMILHAVIQFSLVTITSTYNVIIMLSYLIQQGITQTTQTIASLFDIMVKTTAELLNALTQAIAQGLTIIWQKFVSITQATFTIIETPFKIMGSYYKKTEPSIIYFFSLIKHAADEFTMTAGTIFQLPSEVVKSTPK